MTVAVGFVKLDGGSTVWKRFIGWDHEYLNSNPLSGGFSRSLVIAVSVDPFLEANSKRETEVGDADGVNVFDTLVTRVVGDWSCQSGYKK